jgi:Notch 1
MESFMSRGYTLSILSLIVALASCEGEPGTSDRDCPALNPECGEKDFDGDGTKNADDHFPENPLCSQSDQNSCTDCNVGCADSEYCDLSSKVCKERDLEVCDGIDNDLDDKVDEGVATDSPLADNQNGACTRSVKQCIDGEWVNPELQGIAGYEDNETSCDGFDSDCDGQVDETLDAPLAQNQLGVCTNSKLICNGDKGWVEPDYNDRLGFEDDEATCDGFDNDCDGVIDESNGVNRVAPLIDEQVGVCLGIQKVCLNGQWESPPLSSVVGFESNETYCDGIDSDCDGQIDEGLIAPLAARQEGLCQSSEKVCNGVDGWQEPNYADVDGFENSEVSCDGFDNDCDGQVDEEAGVNNTAPLVSQQAGVCEGLKQICLDGTWASPPLSVVGRYEVNETACDGIDSDCDGQIDEELTAPLAQIQYGVCRGALKVCQGSEGWKNPDYAELEGYELTEMTCDGLDNDCDGVIDETEGVNRTAPLRSEQDGVCNGHIQICFEGVWIDPPLDTIEVYESEETLCDGIDSDCDGHTDENMEMALGEIQLGVCEGSRLRCIEGVILEPDFSLIEGYEPSETVCDGIDSDCDGEVDENIIPPFSEVQEGVCFEVRQLCVEGELSEPDYSIIPSYEEDEVSCDQIDNDCDGQIDEWLDFFEFSCGEGICQRFGIGQCFNGEIVNNCVPGEPLEFEDCNGLDDDCDGVIDEGEGPFLDNQEGVCAGERKVCDMERGGWVNPDLEELVVDYEWPELSCDGIDNDCDGEVDEHSVSATAPLAARQAGLCNELKRSCVNAVFVEPNYAEVIEGYEADSELTCDGIDNDCDGGVDELLVPPPASNQEGVCLNSPSVCGGFRGWIDPNYGDVTEFYDFIEVRCDGLDNDCDGEIDETYSLELIENQEGVCFGVRQACIASLAVEPDLSTVENYEVEEISCDGLDNDCDGVSDEDVLPPLTELQAGVCDSLRMLCVEGELLEPDYDALEDFEIEESTCDGLDNDCDGQVDEGLDVYQSTCGLGICTRYGLMHCIEGIVDTDCLPGIPEVIDRCNGLDDDCDGVTDEGESPLADKQFGVCAGTMQVCIGEESIWVEPNYEEIEHYENFETLCDGLDNDCDGLIDEATHLDAPQAAQQDGVCEGTVLACVAGEYVEPNYQTQREGYEALELTCDGDDNDCDGLVDEDILPPLSSIQVGVCIGSRSVCGGRFGWLDPNLFTVVDEYESRETTCDGIDSDCDGRVDEELSAPLAVRQVGVCAGSRSVCGGAIGWIEPNYSNAIEQYQANETFCDGLDNDCDGAADESLIGPFAERQLGVCLGARQICNGEEEWAEPNYSQIATFNDPEVFCDGLDNDCDGLVDEGTEELCDGLDNDCDGRIDEDLTPSLANLQDGVCEGQTKVCAGTIGWIEPDYVQIPNFEPEEFNVEDGLDNDCDGLTDRTLCSDSCLFENTFELFDSELYAPGMIFTFGQGTGSVEFPVRNGRLFRIKLYGASGGSRGGAPGVGGNANGGMIDVIIDLTEFMGQSLYFVRGGAGQNSSGLIDNSCGRPYGGGSNGGGSGSGTAGAGGGGRTDLRRTSWDPYSELLVAGGGGGNRSTMGTTNTRVNGDAGQSGSTGSYCRDNGGGGGGYYGGQASTGDDGLNSGSGSNYIVQNITEEIEDIRIEGEEGGHQGNGYFTVEILDAEGVNCQCNP